MNMRYGSRRGLCSFFFHVLCRLVFAAPVDLTLQSMIRTPWSVDAFATQVVLLTWACFKRSAPSAVLQACSVAVNLWVKAQDPLHD